MNATFHSHLWSTITATFTFSARLIWVLVILIFLLSDRGLNADETVYAWGLNQTGQLGDGTTVNRNIPGAASNLSGGVTAISAGGNHSLAIQNGAVYSWGLNANGQLGDGTTTNRPLRVAVNNLGSNVSAISAGGSHSLAIRNGSVYAWGLNSFGQIGDGTTTNRNNPILLGGALNGLDVTQIAAGDFHSLALTDDYRLFTWGRNSEGQLGNASFSNSTLPVEIFAPAGFYWSSISGGGSHTLATLTAVPEPSVPVLLIAGTLVGVLRRRRAV